MKTLKFVTTLVLVAAAMTLIEAAWPTLLPSTPGLSWGTVGFAQEKVVLNAPEVKAATTEYSIRYYAVDLENERILIELKSNTGELQTIVYENSAPVSVTTVDVNGKEVVTVTPSDNKAKTLIKKLNKANFSARSLEATLFDELIKDKKLTGVVGGTPR